jgi:choline dehydrogenase
MMAGPPISVTGTDWSYADMLGHFKGIEANSRFNDNYRHRWQSARLRAAPYLRYDRGLLRAAQALGHPYNPDFNGARQKAASASCSATFGQWGRYTSLSPDAKKAFLDPLDGDPRLDIVTDARVDRILIENGRAVGVAYVHNGVTHQAYAERECWLPQAPTTAPADDAVGPASRSCGSTASMSLPTCPGRR